MQGWFQIVLFFAVLLAIVPLLGRYIARVFTGERVFLSPVLGPLERFTYEPREDATCAGLEGVRPLAARLLGPVWLALYLILRTRMRPVNRDFHGAWDLSFNTTSSFVTNTNWQYYGGETMLTDFSPDAGLAVQNFVSAAVGLVVAVVLIRAIAARGRRRLGNFWEDLDAALLHVLLPISFVGALVLASQGVVAVARRRRPVASQESSRSSGPTAAGSTTSTPRSRSRTRTGSRTSSRCWRCSPSRPRCRSPTG